MSRKTQLSITKGRALQLLMTEEQAREEYKALLADLKEIQEQMEVCQKQKERLQTKLGELLDVYPPAILWPLRADRL